MELEVEYKRNAQGPTLHNSNSSDDLLISQSEENNHLLVKIIAKNDITLVKATIYNVCKIKDDDVFTLNGFQSWTDSGEKRLKEHPKEKDVRRIPKFIRNAFALDCYGDKDVYDYKPYLLHGYDIFYIKGSNELFSFNNNYKIAYAIYEINKRDKSLNIISDIQGINLKKDEELVIFDIFLKHSYFEGLEEFKKCFLIKPKEKIFGYTSWYNYYQNINEEIILRDLDALDNRFNLFQIDDGYETFVGDWLDIDKNKFPNGLGEIVNKIHSKNLKAGIWLAPFVAEEKSKLFKENPEYFKRYSDGSFVKCGGNWSGFYALDLSKIEVKDYIRNCLQYYLDLGFDFFKLDFLYASMKGECKGKSRAMMSIESYKLLRDILGDKLILGCGASCFSSYQNFDYLRVGPDVSLIFDDVWFMRHMHRERISTKITLQNTIYRSIFNGHLFLNDPDVFLLRDTNIKLNKRQKEALITINALFGSVMMTSDDIALYDEDSKEVLARSLELFLSAKDVSFKKYKNEIFISYTLNGETIRFTYHSKKGFIR